MISIIIPSYQRPEIITGSLLDLRHQKVFENTPVEIIVGIEESDEENDTYHHYIGQVQAVYQAISEVSITIVEGSFNGLVAAKRAMVERSQYPYLFFMDDDLYFAPNYLHELLSDIQGDTAISGISGYITTSVPAISHTQPSDVVYEIPDTSHLQTLRIDKSLDDWKLVFGKKEQVMDWSNIRKLMLDETRFTMDYFVNSFMCRREDYDATGGFNSNLNSKTSAHEEVDITYRLGRLPGKRLVFNPHVNGWHITVGEGGIYKGGTFDQSRKILEEDYNRLLATFIESITDVRN